jgi:hypothetical protein
MELRRARSGSVTLLHAHHPSIEPLLDKLSLYLSESDMTQVKQVADEIQQRISRFEERSWNNKFRERMLTT